MADELPTTRLGNAGEWKVDGATYIQNTILSNTSLCSLLFSLHRRNQLAPRLLSGPGTAHFLEVSLGFAQGTRKRGQTIGDLKDKFLAPEGRL